MESLIGSMEMAGAYGKLPDQFGLVASVRSISFLMAPVALKCQFTTVENVKANRSNVIMAEEPRMGTLHAP